jgi:hypothetical protein
MKVAISELSPPTGSLAATVSGLSEGPQWVESGHCLPALKKTQGAPSDEDKI